MSACTFFGHGEEKGPDISVLQNAIEEWIRRGVDVFLVGHQGNFDRMVYRCLKQMQTQYPHIRISVVLASLSVEQSDLTDTVYPEIEGHPKFAIERRNRFMIASSEYCICYVNHPWGGAYKFARLAKRKGLTVHNLGVAVIP